MTVVIADTRTLVDHADLLTGWSSDTGAGLALFSTEPDPVEPSDCIGTDVSTATENVYHIFTGVDLTNTIMYVWVLPLGVMDTLANGGIGLTIGDITPDVRSYHVAGSDVAGFRHSEGPVGWQCIVVDTGSLPAFTQNTGGAPTFTAIDRIGAQFKTLAKALGGTENCFIDTVRYGNDGLVVGGGVTGARGTFDEIAVDDRSETSGKAWGICRELGAGVFGLQGPLTFGESGATAAHWFQDTNVTVVFEDRNFVTTRYFFDLAANVTDVGHFQLGLVSGSEGGSDGCTIIVPAGVGGSMDFSDPDFDTVNLYASVFNGFDGGVLFSDDATNGITHDVFACDFILCGTINPGRVDMKNCSIINSSATSALLIEDSDNTLMEKFVFQSDGTGHAIEITHTGAGPHSLTLKGHSYTGYASIDGSTGNEVILYNPGTTSADITITITGEGNTPTIMKAGGVTGIVTIVNNVNLTLTGMKDNTEIRVYTAGTTTELDGVENAIGGSPDNRSHTFALTGGISVDIRFMTQDWIVPDRNSVLSFTWPSVTTTLPVTQVLDRNFENP